MKKILITAFLTIVTFMLYGNVYASSFYSNVLRDVSIHKQTNYADQYRVGGLIKEVGSNKPAYCIEPFRDLIEEYTDYTEYQDFNNIFGLSEEQYERINDIAYFGYGYGNHTDNKWGTITQVMIWRTTNPTDTFEWVDNLSSRNVIRPYEAEISEIESLIANKNTKPSFITDDSIEIESHTELIDTNGVLSDYMIQETYGVNAFIDNNKLIIDAISDYYNGQIKLVRGIDEEQGKLYYHQGSQNVLVRGGFTKVEVTLNVNVIKGSISIIKVDKDYDTNISQGEGDINRAEFELLTDNNELICNISLNEEGKAYINDLEFGRYILREKIPGPGYLLNNDRFEIELTMDNREVEIKVSNKVIESKLKIVKLYGSKEDYIRNTMKFEEGISFDIFDKDDNLVGTITTDEFGTCEILLPYGTYKIVQKNTTENYQMVEDRFIKIDYDSPEEITIVLNDVEIEVPNAGLE